MRALLLEVPDSLTEERKRTGGDRWDEVWEGVLHRVPPPSGWHQHFGTHLLLALAPIAKLKNLEMLYETGVFRPGRGMIEILSKGDESYEKLGFYADVGTREVLIVHPVRRTAELFRLLDGRLVRVPADDTGALHSDVLGVSFRTVDGPKLRVSWTGGGIAEI